MAERQELEAAAGSVEREDLDFLGHPGGSTGDNAGRLPGRPRGGTLGALPHFVFFDHHARRAGRKALRVQPHAFREIDVDQGGGNPPCFSAGDAHFCVDSGAGAEVVAGVGEAVYRDRSASHADAWCRRCRRSRRRPRTETTAASRATRDGPSGCVPRVAEARTRTRGCTMRSTAPAVCGLGRVEGSYQFEPIAQRSPRGWGMLRETAARLAGVRRDGELGEDLAVEPVSEDLPRLEPPQRHALSHAAGSIGLFMGSSTPSRSSAARSFCRSSSRASLPVGSITTSDLSWAAPRERASSSRGAAAVTRPPRLATDRPLSNRQHRVSRISRVSAYRPRL